MVLKLPERGRPRGVHYRQCALGVDLPAQFYYDLTAIDQHLHLIFHPYQLLWDDMVNEYTGPLEDPRYPIVENSHKYGQIVMGHVLTNGQGEPSLDGSWHVWRWCEPAAAWAHVINIDSRDPLYLQLLVKRLHLAAVYNDKYGHRGYQKLMEQADIDRREKLQADKADMMDQISKVNSAMLNRVRDNFERGIVNSTNPEKETIMSGGGIKGARKLVRPLDDHEGGLILPEEFGGAR